MCASYEPILARLLEKLFCALEEGDSVVNIWACDMGCEWIWLREILVLICGLAVCAGKGL